MAEERVTPYQARLYNAVIFGTEHGKRKPMEVVRRLWKSRRVWQQRALDAEARLRLVESLCGAQQRATRNGAAPVRADHLVYAMNPGGYFRAPEGFEAAVEVAAQLSARKAA
ncbi:hypothetical protein ACFWU5_16450 [Nocardia sp. NPDC058640]|uniref:hypothetical protein n=1 Tax=Nocardia sp. NPDC058640 TaxID=3346571 RepID=UPI0036593727